MPERTDEQLVMLTLNGDQSAFGILVERYQKQVFSLAYRLSGDYSDAQDMAQEAFIRIYQELPHYDPERRFFPWMYRVAHNTCINVLAKRPKEQTTLDAISDINPDHDQTIDPERSLALGERSEMIAAALKSLPDAYREPLVLKYLEGMSYRQIAEILGVPESTIETRLFRGRNMLKKALAGYIKG